MLNLERYKKIRKLVELNKEINENIEINRYVCDDLYSKPIKKVILKEIVVNEADDIKSLVRFMWHHEISLNNKAFASTNGKYLLSLNNAFVDKERDKYYIITDYFGPSISDLFTNPDYESEVEEMEEDLITKRHIRWKPLLMLVKALYSLHSNMLIHRNISPLTIYFSAETLQQGNLDVFRLGDFSWSIYLYSMANIFTNKKRESYITTNFHFWRAPECLKIKDDSDCGESFSSDIFSLGLVFSLLFIRKNLQISELLKISKDDQVENIEKIRKEISSHIALNEDEKNILLKMIEINKEERYQKCIDIIEDIESLIRSLDIDFLFIDELPVTFPLTFGFIKHYSNIKNLDIQYLAKKPQENILEKEFDNVQLFLSKNEKYPIWTIGRSGTKYALSLGKERNFANLSVLGLKRRELTDIPLTTARYFRYYDRSEELEDYSCYMLFKNAKSLIKRNYGELTQEEIEKKEWNEAQDQIFYAEKDIERAKIFEYEIYDTSINNRVLKKGRIKRFQIKVKVYKGQYNFSLLQTSKLPELLKTFVVLSIKKNFKIIKEHQKWEIKKVLNNTGDILELELTRPGIEKRPPKSGYIFLYELRRTWSLIDRKHRVLENVKLNDVLINAFLYPASSHRTFQENDDRDITERIMNRYPIFLLQGPPGTGKTYTATQLVKKMLQENPYSRLLITSKEHFALNDLLIKIFNMTQEEDFEVPPILVRIIPPEKEQEYLPNSEVFRCLVRQNTKLLLNKMKQWKTDNKELLPLQEEIQNYIIEEEDAPDKQWDDIVKFTSNIVFCTTTTNDLRDYEDSPLFDLAIVEEAGKAYPSELFGPLLLANKWVLIGDQNQLPPFMIIMLKDILNKNLDLLRDRKENEDEDFDLQEFKSFKSKTMEITRLFNYSYEKFNSVGGISEDQKSCAKLMNQYRLPSKISEMISSIFYSEIFTPKIIDPLPGEIITAPEEFDNEQLIWISTPLSSSRFSDFRETREKTTFYNSKEADIVVKILNIIELGKKRDDDEISIAIITPYKRQRQEIINRVPETIKDYNGKSLKKCVYTIDSFQGQEADIIIISLTRNNRYNDIQSAWGFVIEKERLNVMFSRSKGIIIVIGADKMINSFKTKTTSKYITQIFDFFKLNGKIIRATEVLEW